MSLMISRRQFVFDCSAIAAAFSVAPISTFSLPAALVPRFQSLEQISHQAFAGQINSTFRVLLSPRRVVELKLLKAPLAPSLPATLGCRAPGDAGHEKFSLIFGGPADRLLSSAIHRFENDRLGRFEMYIGQVGTTDADDVRYEAGFNRPIPAALAVKNLT